MLDLLVWDSFLSCFFVMDGLGFIPGSWSLVKGNSRSARTAGRCQMSEVSPTSYRVNLGPLEVSPLGVGAWSWGDDFYWGKGDENVRSARPEKLYERFDFL